MNKLITILVNGDWDTALEDRDNKEVIIYDEGQKYLMNEDLVDTFIDNLDYDCYLILEQYSHPQWNGIFRYI